MSENKGRSIERAGVIGRCSGTRGQHAMDRGVQCNFSTTNPYPKLRNSIFASFRSSSLLALAVPMLALILDSSIFLSRSCSVVVASLKAIGFAAARVRRWPSASVCDGGGVGEASGEVGRRIRVGSTIDNAREPVRFTMSTIPASRSETRRTMRLGDASKHSDKGSQDLGERIQSRISRRVILVARSSDEFDQPR